MNNEFKKRIDDDTLEVNDKSNPIEGIHGDNMAEEQRRENWLLPTGWYVPGIMHPDDIPEPGPIEQKANMPRFAPVDHDFAVNAMIRARRTLAEIEPDGDDGLPTPKLW